MGRLYHMVVHRWSSSSNNSNFMCRKLFSNSICQSLVPSDRCSRVFCCICQALCLCATLSASHPLRMVYTRITQIAERKQHPCPSNARCWFRHFLAIYCCLDKKGRKVGYFGPISPDWQVDAVTTVFPHTGLPRFLHRQKTQVMSRNAPPTVDAPPLVLPHACLPFCPPTPFRACFCAPADLRAPAFPCTEPVDAAHHPAPPPTHTPDWM